MSQNILLRQPFAHHNVGRQSAHLYVIQGFLLVKNLPQREISIGLNFSCDFKKKKKSRSTDWIKELRPHVTWKTYFVLGLVLYKMSSFFKVKRLNF